DGDCRGELAQGRAYGATRSRRDRHMARLRFRHGAVRVRPEGRSAAALRRSRRRRRRRRSGPAAYRDVAHAGAGHHVRRHPDGETVLRGLRQRSCPDPGRAELCVRSAAASALHRELRFPAHGIWRGAHRGLSRHRCAAYADAGAASRTAGALLVIVRFPARRFIARVARHAILILTAAFALLPFFWMVSLSLKPPEEIFQADFHLWPTAFHGVENYRVALTTAPMFGFLLNGLLVCAAIFALQLLVCIPCA